MKTTDKNELRYMGSRIVLLGILAGFMVYIHQPKLALDRFNEKNSPLTFEMSRQVLSIHKDSLSRLTEKILEKEPDAFRVQIKGSEWHVTAGNVKAFERIFLDGEPLSNWQISANEIITKHRREYGFFAKIQMVNGKAFVILPAEIVQSLQLAL